MNEEIQLFDSVEFGSVRTVSEDGVALFCSTDIAKALGYARPADAVTAHCRGSVIRRPLKTPGGMQDVKFISESDVYRLISHSKMPAAKAFEKWLFEEVAPSVVRTGSYNAIDPAKLFSDPDSILRICENWKADRERRIELEAENAELAPKALFADSVANADNLILVRELAHILRQNGIDVGQNRLFEWLREDGYLEKRRNEPTQRSLDLGIMRVVEHSHTKPDGSTFVTRTPKITAKGQVYFVRKYAGSGKVA